jgi:glycosyltransferase involved in cell wall biosynthesis
VTQAGPQAARPRLSAIVIPARPSVPNDDSVMALTQHTPDHVEIRTVTADEVNTAVAQAGTEIVCLLDAQVFAQPGWYEPLRELLDAQRGRGEAVAATSCVLDVDGRVMEAGTMIGGGGSWYSVEAGATAEKPGVRFLRAVEGSSSLVVLERDSFLRIGGFDAQFTTFPVAAMDLCLRILENGGRIWYEPSSRMTWVPAPLSSRERERIEADRVRLRQRRPAGVERPVLEDLDQFAHRALAIRDALAIDRVLVIDDRVPHHDRGAGDPRMRQIVEEMIALWPQARITLLAADSSGADQYAPALLHRGIEVVWPSDIETWLHTRLFHYSIVVVSRPDNFSRFDAGLRRTQPQALRVFDAEALFSRRLERMQAVAASEPERDALRELERQARSSELAAAAEGDAVWCVTPEEEAVLSAVAPSTPRFPVIYFAETYSDPRGFAAREDLVFFGGFFAGENSPNEDAVLYLVKELMPRLWKHDPALKLHVVGADPTPAVRSLDSDLVDVVGRVDDPRPWLDRTLVHISPMRFGSGLKLRFVETIAAGQPLVTSSVGAEGLGLGELLTEALVADDADAQVSLVLELISNGSRWERAHDGVLAIAREKFGRERFRSDLVEAMSHLGVAPPVDLDGV